MLISSQNHTNRSIIKQTTFKGIYDQSNVISIADRTGANFYNDFNMIPKTKDGMTPARQITKIRLPGGDDFDVLYSVRPSSIPKASVICATASINGYSAEGLETHLHKKTGEFGEDLAKATEKAANALAMNPTYIAQRVNTITILYKYNGFNMHGLSTVCGQLQGHDKHDFLTRLSAAVVENNQGQKNVHLKIDAKKLTVTIGDAVHRIKRPFFAFFKSEGQILADRLLKVLR